MPNNSGFRLAAINRVNVYQEVLSQIDAYISENGLQPGDRLPSDREMAQSLGVSRVVIRQALKVLEGFGRVDARQGSGTYVRGASYTAVVAELLRGITASPDFIHQVVSVRIIADMAVFEAAFERRNPENLAVVRRALDDRLSSLDHDTEDADLNFSFEAALGAICGNELLHRLQMITHQIWVQAWASTGSGPADKRLFHAEHEAIFDAFSRGEREGAFALFEAHLDANRVFERLKHGSPEAAPTLAEREPGRPRRDAPRQVAASARRRVTL